MSELRIFRKKDSTEVLQQSVEVPNMGQNGIITGEGRYYEWKDVPVVCEVLKSLRTGKIQSVSWCAGGECGKNGSEIELVVTHRLYEDSLGSWSENDIVVNDALPDYRMIIRHVNILLLKNGYSKVKYLMQSYEVESPNAYIPKDLLLKCPCLSLYDQEHIDSKRKPKNEVVSFSFGSSLNVGSLQIRHFKSERGVQLFKRWDPGQVIANRRDHQRSKWLLEKLR